MKKWEMKKNNFNFIHQKDHKRLLNELSQLQEKIIFLMSFFTETQQIFHRVKFQKVAFIHNRSLFLILVELFKNK